MIVGGGALVGAILLLLLERFRDRLLAWAARDPARVSGRSAIVLLVIAVLGAVPTLGMGLYLWRLGSRTIREGRYPPSGVRMLRDTIVVRGRPAVWRGGVARVLGGALLVAALALLFFLWRIWALLGGRG